MQKTASLSIRVGVKGIVAALCCGILTFTITGCGPQPTDPQPNNLPTSPIFVVPSSPPTVPPATTPDYNNPSPLPPSNDPVDPTDDVPTDYGGPCSADDPMPCDNGNGDNGNGDNGNGDGS